MLDVKLFESQAFLPLPYEAVLAPRLKRIQEKLRPGGWRRLPQRGEETAARLRAAAARIRECSEVVVSLGGGPGPRGLVECLRPWRDEGPALCFPEDAGISAGDLPALLGDKDFSVISASSGGGALAGRLRASLESRYGAAEARRRFFGPEDWGDETPPPEGWDLLGGPALLPAAVAGADVEALLAGAAEMMEACGEDSFANPAWRYAAIRHQLYRSGRTVEVLACCDASLRGLLEWRQRLAAGSEGKENKGLFPAWAVYPQDLATLGQAVQQGRQPVLETLLCLGGLERGGIEETVLRAHAESGVPCAVVSGGGEKAGAAGQAVYLFQHACALSCGLLDVDPFRRAEACRDMPGRPEEPGDVREAALCR